MLQLLLQLTYCYYNLQLCITTVYGVYGCLGKLMYYDASVVQCIIYICIY